MMSRLLPVLVCLLLPAAANGAEPAARVRASVATKGDAWVGQRVTLVVELLAPGFFSSAPAFDLPQVPGVVVAGPEGNPTVGSETIEGVSYTVQRHELAVYAQRAGTVTVPAFAVRFGATEQFGKPEKEYCVTAPPVSFTAKLPPGAEGLATVVTTRELTVKETWAPEPGAAKVGAAFTRTITVEARDVPGMVLPSFAFAPPDGLRAYTKTPEVSDHSERGDLTGRRVETVTYVCEKPGAYELPALVLAWWNPREQKLNRAKLPARSFEVTAPPEPPAPTAVAPVPTSHKKERLVAVGVLVLVAGLAGWWFAPALVARWKRYRTRAAKSERALFTTFERACPTSDAHATYRALTAWLARSGFTSVEQFSLRAADGALTAELTALQDAVFKPGAPGSAQPRAELAKLARIARRRLSHAAHEARQHAPALPPLNPVPSEAPGARA